MLQYRHKSRAWRQMVTIDDDGNAMAIKDRIAQGITARTLDVRPRRRPRRAHGTAAAHPDPAEPPCPACPTTPRSAPTWSGYTETLHTLLVSGRGTRRASAARRSTSTGCSPRARTRGRGPVLPSPGCTPMPRPRPHAVTLPDGAVVRGRGRRELLPPGPPPTFGLCLGRDNGSFRPGWQLEWVDWPDFRTPRDPSRGGRRHPPRPRAGSRGRAGRDHLRWRHRAHRHGHRLPGGARRGARGARRWRGRAPTTAATPSRRPASAVGFGGSPVPSPARRAAGR